MDDTYKRVARALADVEQPAVRDQWYERFLWALRNGAIPAGRITSNAGAEIHKPATSTINCTVSGTIRDSMDDILDKVHEAGLTLKAGCGIGYEFSTLRPRGAYVSAAPARTRPGPLSFMDIYDKMCFTVSSAGGRRGAQMGTFDVGHPDAMDFIRAKREDGRLRQFNLSLLITDEFMAGRQERPRLAARVPGDAAGVRGRRASISTIRAQVVWREWPTQDNYVVRRRRPRRLPRLQDAAGAPHVGRHHVVDLRLRRARLRAHRSRQRDEQQLVVREHPRHQPVRRAAAAAVWLVPARLDQPHALRRRIRSREHAYFDWDEFREVVQVFTRMLDNVVEVNGLPLEQQRDEIMRKRRHGMGFLGLGSAITLLGMKYGSPESVQFTEDVSREMAIAGWEAGLELAHEKGPAPIMLEEFAVTGEMLRKRPEMARDGWQVGPEDSGPTAARALQPLHAARARGRARARRRSSAEVGARFTHHSSIAPTGTISLSLANNASNGIEPSFAHHYFRNVIRAGQEDEGEGRRLLVRAAGVSRARQSARDAGLDEAGEKLPDYFTSCRRRHARASTSTSRRPSQKWIDSSISKTANVPTDYQYDDFKDIYLYAHEKGLKGCTTFRFNPEAFQGVLVKEEGPEEHDVSSSRSRTAARSRSRATKRSSTTARRTPPRISSMR